MIEHGSEHDFKECYDAFMAIPKDELTYCNMPLEVAAAEGTQLSLVAAEDRDRLLAAGIDSIYVDSLGGKKLPTQSLKADSNSLR